MSTKKKRLGDLLVEAGIIDELQLRAALGQQAKWGKSLGRTLIEMRLLDEQQLMPILSQQLNIQTVDLASRELDPKVTQQLDEHFCREHECLPFAYQDSGKFLDVAMTDAQSPELFDQIRVKTRCNVRPFLAGPVAVRDAIDRAFGGEELPQAPGFVLNESIISFDGESESTDAAASEAEPAADAGDDVQVLPSGAADLAPHLDPLRRQLAALQQRVQRQEQVLQTLWQHLRRTVDTIAQQQRSIESLTAAQAQRPPAPPPVPGKPAPAPPPPTRPPATPPAIDSMPPLEIDVTTDAPALQPGSTDDINVDVIFDGMDTPAAEPATAKAQPAQPAQPGPAAASGTPAKAQPAQPAQPGPAAASAVQPPRPRERHMSREVRREAPRPEGSRVRPMDASAQAEGTESLPLINIPPGTNAVVAMDLGTTRSSVAAAVDGRVSVFRLPDGDWDMPSVVGFRQDGSVVLGKAAQRMLASDPANAISSPKRLLGRRFDEKTLEPYLINLGMKAEEAPNHGVMLRTRGKSITVVEVCAHILNMLRLVAEKALQREVADVILTTPVSFTDRQYRALRAAAELAKLRVVEFVDEPVAATLACVSDPLCQGLVAIFDFGGGTLDFSVVNVGPATMEVVTSAGDSWLGGDDFDAALASAAANGFWRKTNIELRNQAHQWQRLLVAAEKSKRELTIRESSQLLLRKAALTKEGALDLVYPVTRAQFTQLSNEIIERSLTTCGDALELTDLKPRDIAAVYLSGGTTYIPAVRKAVAQMFGKPPRVVVPPERAVLLGAAIHGALYPQEVASAEEG